jgi:RHS repeat-associated protein
VRDYLNGSTSNTGDHWVEIEVYGSRTVAYIGNYYEWDASANTPTKYYYAGAERVAMRTGTGSGTTGLKWLLDDHLGSTAITADGVTGTKLSELRYKPWGEIRYASQPTMTDRRYTGQRMEGIGLYDYGARWFDASLGRFVQADSIVPNLGDPQAWDRYAAMNNNPVIFVDPSGHWACEGADTCKHDEFPSVRPVLKISLKYNSKGDYDQFNTWKDVNKTDILARLLIAEERDKILDPIMEEDVVGVAWVIRNRTESDKYFNYARDNYVKAIIKGNTALSGTNCSSGYCAGNAAFAANPEGYKIPREVYWRAYEIASKVINRKIADPTGGALYFSDANYEGQHYERTHFKYVYGGPSYSISELRNMDNPPW